MKESSVPAGIGAEGWAATPPAVRVLVAALQGQVAEVGTLLRAGQALTQAKTGGTGDHLVELEPALWTFASAEGVEPTNNAAERALRRAVFWRKRSLGTKTTLAVAPPKGCSRS